MPFKGKALQLDSTKRKNPYSGEPEKERDTRTFDLQLLWGRGRVNSALLPSLLVCSKLLEQDNKTPEH